MDQRSNDGSTPFPITNISKREKARTGILAKEGSNVVNQEISISTGDITKETKKLKKVSDLRLLEKISDGIKVRCAAALDKSKVNYEIDGQVRKRNVNKEKRKRHKGENFEPSGKFYNEEISHLGSRAINSVNESRECKKKQNKNMKKEKHKGLTNFNFPNNSFAEGVANLKDEIVVQGLMGSDKDQKKQRKKKENYKGSENSTSFIDSFNLNEVRNINKKRKMEYFLESKGGEGILKKKVKGVLDNAYKVLAEGDAKEDLQTLNIGKDSNSNDLYNCELKTEAKKGKKKVTFSEKIEEFPLAQCSKKEINSVNLVQGKELAKEDELNFVWGKRFTPEEDELIRKAIKDYIEVNQLGEQGLHMILHSSKYRKQVKGCWKFIASALPWRPPSNTYYRAHTIFEKSVERKWKPEEVELLKRFYAQNGSDWKKFGEILGKSRHQVKDTYRRIKPENLKKGKWGQDEYQALFDLVNLDLQMKAFQEKKHSHAMLKGNISWEAISAELSTRGPYACCLKWYHQLTSSMVDAGHWNDLDDYKMINAIQKTDPSCFEDVDWGNLLENRSGRRCRKRWYEMIKFLDRFWAIPFVEQIDLLSQRYCPDMIPFIQKNSEPPS